MIGLMLKEMFLDAVNQGQENMVRTDLMRIYGRLDEACLIWLRETQALTDECTITTVLDTQRYDLPADFIRMRPYQRSGAYGRPVGIIRYDYGDNTAWPQLTSYERIFRANRTDSRQVPEAFTVVDNRTTPSQVTGTTSAAGAVANGVAVLTDAATDFSSIVGARDMVLNTTRNSRGIVLGVTGTTTARCALFPEGLQSWNSGDSYVIQPMPRKQIMLDAPSLEAGHTFMVPYYAKPDPVFHELGSWRLEDTACSAIAKEAAFLHQATTDGLKANPVLHDFYMDALRAERRKIALRASRGE